MYDHIGLKVKDLEAALGFYAAALKPLGHVVCAQEEGCAGIGLNNEPALWLYAAKGTTTNGASTAVLRHRGQLTGEQR